MPTPNLGQTFLSPFLIRQQAQRAEREMFTRMITPLMVDLTKHRDNMDLAKNLDDARTDREAEKNAQNYDINLRKVQVQEDQLKLDQEQFEWEQTQPKDTKLSPSGEVAKSALDERQKAINKRLVASRKAKVEAEEGLAQLPATLPKKIPGLGIKIGEKPSEAFANQQQIAMQSTFNIAKGRADSLATVANRMRAAEGQVAEVKPPPMADTNHYIWQETVPGATDDNGNPITFEQDYQQRLSEVTPPEYLTRENYIKKIKQAYSIR